MNLDMKKFKKVSSDKKSTLLRHDDGHELKIAHSGVSPKMMKQLHALPMAEGGMVDPYEKHSEEKEKPSSAQQVQDSFNQSTGFGSLTPKPKEKKPAKQYAEGGEVEQSQDQQPDNKSPVHITINAGQPQQPNTAQLGSPEQPYVAQDQDRSGQISEGQQGGLLQQLRGGAGSPLSTIQPQPEQQQQPQQPMQSPEELMKMKAEADQLNALQGNALNSSQGKDLAQAYQNHINTQSTLQDSYNVKKAALDQEHANLINDIKAAHIDPDQYWDTHSKGKAILGLLLGGVGAGLTRGPNVAAELLQHQQDAFVDAQKANLGKSNSLLAAIQHQYKNNQDSTDFLRIMSNEMMLEKANKFMAPINNQQAQINLANMKMQLANNTEQLKQGIATRSAQRELEGVSQNPQQPPSSREAHIAHAVGVIAQSDPKRAETIVDGLASTSGVPAEMLGHLSKDTRASTVLGPDNRYWNAGSKENAKEYNEQVTAFRPLMSDLNELSTLNTLESRVSPEQRARAQVLKNHIVVELNDMAKAHRITEADIEFQKGQLSDPTALSTILSGNAGTQQLMRSVSRKMQSVSQQYLPNYKPINFKPSR